MSQLRPLRRAGVVTVVLAGLVAAGAGTASAHVRVSSPDAAPGGYGKFVFRVPDESDTASTVDLRIQLPTGTPLSSVQAEPVPGWTVTLTSSPLPKPVTTDDGDTITSAVSVVEYKADAGGIAPGQFQEFALSGGPIPKVESLTFNAVQSYSDGTQAAWIEPTVAGQAEPEHPAPVLSLAAAPSTAGASSSAGSASAASSAAPAASRSADGGNGTAVTALVVGVLGLLAGLAGLGLGLAARRRTVSS